MKAPLACGSLRRIPFSRTEHNRINWTRRSLTVCFVPHENPPSIRSFHLLTSQLVDRRLLLDGRTAYNATTSTTATMADERLLQSARALSSAAGETDRRPTCNCRVISRIIPCNHRSFPFQGGIHPPIVVSLRRGSRSSGAHYPSIYIYMTIVRCGNASRSGHRRHLVTKLSGRSLRPAPISGGAAIVDQHIWPFGSVNHVRIP